MSGTTVVHETTETVNGMEVTFCLWSDGRFTADGVEKPWFKTPDGAPWMVKKRKSFRSLVKQSINDGDFDL